MKRAAVYARVSTDGQRDNYSIPTQVASCHEFAKQKGYAVIGDRYVDSITGFDSVAGNGNVLAYVDNYTSRELSRPSLDQAISYLEQTGYDVLIVYTLDRLARDPYIRRTLELEFEQHGAAVEYVQGDYDQSPEGEVRKDLEATFAKWENAKRVERSMRGAKAKAERGLFVSGQPPYGYKINRDVPGGLEVDENQAQIVRRIFSLFVEDRLSIRGITELLSDEGVKTFHGRTNWAKSTVARILGNSTYAGRWYYNRRRGRGLGRPVQYKEREKWIEVEVTPIVEEHIFDMAQERLKKNKQRRRRNPKRFYLLSGMVICELCKRPYGSQTQKAGKHKRKNDAPAYRHRVKDGHCKNRMVSARLLEPLVWYEILTLLVEPENLKRGYSNALDQQKAAFERHRTLHQTLSKGLEKLERTRQNLTKIYIDPDIGLSKAEYLEQKQNIDAEIKQTKEKLMGLEAELDQVPIPGALESLDVFMEEIMSLFEDGYELTPKIKRKLFEFLHVEVFLGEDDDIRIEGWFETRSTRLLSTTSGHCDPRRPTLPWPASRVPGP
ncbi:MAG: hypothetical protein AMJ56_05025 [Anaerolineae bacterium SG8_19]|nr:MAG: hypothetical protein AMJ56_05025 [Anaerolineae bacterium SG8_19]